MYTFMGNAIIFIPGKHARSLLIKQLIAQGFTGFRTIPYPLSGNQAIIAPHITSGYTVVKEITETDALDKYIMGTLLQNRKQKNKNTLFTVPEKQRQNRTGIYLFKNTQDLKDL